MNFEKVLPALREGKKVRRIGNKVLTFSKEGILWDGKNPLNHLPDIKISDLISDDWEIVEEREE